MYARACPVASVITEFSGFSTMDQGGGKRRGAIADRAINRSEECTEDGAATSSGATPPRRRQLRLDLSRDNLQPFFGSGCAITELRGFRFEFLYAALGCAQFI